VLKTKAPSAIATFQLRRLGLCYACISNILLKMMEDDDFMQITPDSPLTVTLLL
jgi:hypothetical protein